MPEAGDLAGRRLSGLPVIGSVVIVGASIAGMHAAHGLRREGFDGRITVIDGEPDEPYDKPPLSKQVLKGDWEPDRIVLPAAREELDIDWRLGEHALSLDLADRFVRLGAGERVGFDGLVLATGASARHLPGTAGMGGVFVLRTLDDCLGLRAELDKGPSRVVVIGAGFIGSEVAATCRERGLEVTILEMAEVPLERALGARMGMVCADLHRDHGVDLRLGVGVDGLVGTDRVEGVRLANGEVIDAEVVVVGIGVVPTTGWIDGSGLTVDNGVVVDSTLEAAPGVVAAGDIARYPSRRFGEVLRIEHWENAVQMGAAAAKRLLVAEHADAETYDPVPYFWSDQYDRKIQLVGRSGADDDVEVVHGSTDERRFVALYGRKGRVVGVLGMNRARHVMQLKALVDEGVSWDDGLERARAL
jgi:3-phenylpropionate/trans-cinnamate dioxygenase ferredoxin reductase subunit